jgi:Spx/MgsR family transcriptional regulator
MDKITIYGIPNCDTTKKALNWLNKNKIAYSFHDYKQEGISAKKLEEWSKKAGWEAVLNKRSTTWRELPEAEQQKVKDKASAINVMMMNNSIIKRPIIEKGNELIIGYNEKAMQQL